MLRKLQDHALVFEGRELLAMLGYPYDKPYYIYFDALISEIAPTSNLKLVRMPPMTADIYAGFHHLYVYCDIVKAQRVGDVFASFLDHVSISSYEKNLINHRPNPVHYLPLAYGWINTIHVYLRNELGHKVPFTSGKVLLKLHFRKRLLA